MYNLGGVDSSVEFFNGEKWKSVSDYANGDLVLGCDNFGNAKMYLPEEYKKIECNHMYKYISKHGLNIIASPDQIMVYLNYRNNISFKSIENIAIMHNKSKHGFSGKVMTSFKYSGGGLNLKDNEIMLMCAIIADGTFPSKGTNRCVLKFKKDRKKEELEKILNTFDFEYAKYDCANDYRSYVVYAPIKEKVFGKHWYKCSANQLKTVCDNIMLWDGHIKYTPSGTNRNEFSTKRKESADFIQFAYSATGTTATLSTSVRNRAYKNGEVDSIEYRVLVGNKSNIGFESQNKANFELVCSTDGYKYNFIIPNDNIIYRYDDKIFVTRSYKE